MKWCRVSEGGSTYFGSIENDRINLISDAPFGEYTYIGKSIPLEHSELLVPVIPNTFYAAGINYMDHVNKMAAITGRPGSPPDTADIGYRANSALIAHGQSIVLPKEAGEKTQYEAELVVVIGKAGKRIQHEQVWDHIFGYTIGNDFSERTWQAGDRTLWRAKNADTFNPMGPWIETDVDINQMRTIVRVNGYEVENFKTNNMIFDIPTYVCRMSECITLLPGDVIWMGTDGVPEDGKPGDIIEIELSGIGVLRNSVVKET